MNDNSESTHVANPSDSMLISLARAALASGDRGDYSWPALDLSDPLQRAFGDYELLEEIGRGGMGVVYRARQHSLDRDVAIKFITAGFADSINVACFLDEARAAARLMHPNIVAVHEVGSIDQVHYFSMPLVKGVTLAALLEQAPMPLERVLAIMLELCEAMDYAHRLDLLHLDLKPANVLIDARSRPLIADFGLARHMDGVGGVDAQEVSGTPAFMAPEQILIKQYRLTPATDVYALGAILYRCITGKSAHGDGSPDEMIRRAAAGRIRDPRELNPAISRDLAAVCKKCLELQPADRYGTAAQLADDLRHVRDGSPVSVRQIGWTERAGRWFRREPRLAIAVTTAALTLVLGAAFSGWQWREAELAREHALVQRELAERERAGAEGLARLIMSQTPAKAPPILHPVEGFKIPVIDCTETNINCGGGLDPYTTIDPKLPLAQRRHYLESLRAYVPKIAAWGNPHLSAQLAQKLDGAEHQLYRVRRAQAAAATNSSEGFLFAYLLAAKLTDPELDRTQVSIWFDRALAEAERPWQAQALAQACDAGEPACAKAITRFRELDPDNAAAWIVGLPKELGEEGDQHVLRAASSARLDNHASDLLDAAVAFAGRLLPTLHPSVRVTPTEFALEAWYQTGVFAYPHYYCKKSFGERDAPAIEDACRAIIGKIQPAMHPNMLDEIMAAVMTMRMSSDPAVQAQAWQRLRNARWVYSVWKQLPPDSQRDTTVMLRIYREQGEMAYLKSLVVAAHLPLEAPGEFVTREPLPWARHATAAAKQGEL